jgi:glycosyltransferase involved in cell wall biosynthesis
VPSPSSSRRPVAVVVHAYFEEDARVRRKVDALAASGREVDVFALRREGEPAVVDDGPIRVHHLPVGRHQGAGIATYLREYLAFLVRAAIALAAARGRRRYALVDVNSLPDFLVVAALPLRLVGVPILLDLHEAMPEFFATRFPRATNPIARWVLAAQERLSIRVANAVVTVNDSLADRLRSLGVQSGKVTVVLNSPSLDLFDRALHPRRAFMEDGRLRLIYAGALTPIYELDVVLRALARLASDRPDLDPTLAIYGRGDSEPSLRQLAEELGLGDRVEFGGRIPLEAVPAAVASADVGVAPTRRDAFTERSLSTKLFEYAAMGKPVVASDLPTIGRYFPDGTIARYPSGDAAGLAAAVLRLVDDEPARSAAIVATAGRLEALSWERQAATYLELVDRLAGDDGLSSRPSGPDAPAEGRTEGV